MVERAGKWRELDYTAPVYPSFACGAGNVLSADLVRWLAFSADHLKLYQVHPYSLFCLIIFTPYGANHVVFFNVEVIDFSGWRCVDGNLAFSGRTSYWQCKFCFVSWPCMSFENLRTLRTIGHLFLLCYFLPGLPLVVWAWVWCGNLYFPRKWCRGTERNVGRSAALWGPLWMLLVMFATRRMKLVLGSSYHCRTDHGGLKLPLMDCSPKREQNFSFEDAYQWCHLFAYNCKQSVVEEISPNSKRRRSFLSLVNCELTSWQVFCKKRLKD